MKQWFKALSLLLFICAGGTTTVAQEKWSKSLLWRITGNGLSKPSYLFGTMHVREKEAFNFKDSLYYFIEHTDAFAMEFHPDSSTNIVTAMINGELKDDDFDWKAQIDEKDRELLSGKAAKNWGLDKKKLDKATLLKIYSRAISAENNKDSMPKMPTFMDAYLFNMSREMGKEAHGLEKIADQLSGLKSLAKNMDVKRLMKMLEKWEPGQPSPIQSLYMNEDLQGIIDFFYEYYTPNSLEGFLFKRNEVMARQMDSLMRIKTLFTAVGAGHLPGTRGVISLLREKGYTVEPVYSNKRIAAENYQYTAIKKEWVTITDENFGVQWQMPAKPQNPVSSNGSRLDMHYDIGNGIVYMAAAGKVEFAERNKSEEAMFKSLMGKFTDQDSRLLERKKLTENGQYFNEALYFDVKEKAYTRFRIYRSGPVYYMMFAASESKEVLYGPLAKKFFQSFQLFRNETKEWTVTNSRDDGFTMLMPGKPVITTAKKGENNTDRIQYNLYSATSSNDRISFDVSAEKTLADFNYIEDSSFFRLYITDMEEKAGSQTPTVTDTLIQGLPAKKIQNQPFDDKVAIMYVVRRGNRCYVYSVECDEANQHDPDIEKFLRSFTIVPLENKSWKTTASPDQDFSAWLPSLPEAKEEPGNTYRYYKSHKKEFYAYDAVFANTYSITRDTISHYYWADNADSIYNNWKENIVNSYSDSLLSMTTVTNGPVTGREFLTIARYNKTVTKTRLLLNGPLMYTLSCRVHAHYPESADSKKFFSDFRFTEVKDSRTIFTNTPDRLFTDLYSTDSTTFSNATLALENDVVFTKRDLPLLLKKSIEVYHQQEGEFYTINERLFRKLNTLLEEQAGPAEQAMATAFVEKNYLALRPEQDKFRYEMLNLLARVKTDESYALLKKLMLQQLPQHGLAYQLFYSLEKNLSLSRNLYPALLQFGADSIAGLQIIALAKQLKDSSLLSSSAILPYKKVLLQMGANQLKALLTPKDADYDDEERYEIHPFIELAGSLKDEALDKMLTGFLKVRQVMLNRIAAITLLKNNKPVSEADWMKIADDRANRIDLYDDLEKLGKGKLFPAKYRSQRMMAEGYLVASLREDEDNELPEPSFAFLQQKEYTFRGKKQRFWLYKISFTSVDPDTEETTLQSYLGIAGPFELNHSQFIISNDKNITGLYYDAAFNRKSIDTYFEDYIKQRLKYLQDAAPLLIK